MIVTLTQFDRLAADAAGNMLPLGSIGMGSQSRTSNGAFTALDVACNFLRVAGDTNITLTDATGRVFYFPANSPEYIGVGGGDVFTLAQVV
jgi:hypothetical protein